jgi:hypothetical protein
VKFAAEHEKVLMNVEKYLCRPQTPQEENERIGL